MAEALQNGLKEEVGNFIPESLSSSLNHLPLQGLKDKASSLFPKFLPGAKQKSHDDVKNKTKPHSGDAKKKAKKGTGDAKKEVKSSTGDGKKKGKNDKHSKKNGLVDAAEAGEEEEQETDSEEEESSDEEMPTSAFPEDLDPTGLLQSASGLLPQGLNPSQLLSPSHASAGIKKFASKSLTSDVLPKGFNPSKFLSSTHGSDETEKKKKSRPQKGASPSKFRAGGLLGSALSGIKKAASQALPTDLIPEGLMDSAESALAGMKSAASETLSTATDALPDDLNPSQLLSHSDDPASEGGKKAASKSLTSDVLPGSFDPSKFLSATHNKPAGKKAKKTHKKVAKEDRSSPSRSFFSGGLGPSALDGMKKAASTSVLDDLKDGDFTSIQIRSPTPDAEDGEVYIGGGSRKYSGIESVDSYEEDHLIGKVKTVSDDFGTFLDVQLMGTSRRPSADLLKTEAIQEEIEIEMEEEEEEKKPKKSCCRWEKLTLGFTMFSTAIVSFSSLGSIGLNTTLNSSIKSMQRQQKKNDMNNMQPSCYNSCQANEFRHRFEALNMSLLVLGDLLMNQPGFASLTGPGETFSNPASSCTALKMTNPSLPSDFYWLASSSGGQPVRRYCDMWLTCGGVTGGWMRVGHLDTREVTSVCPAGFRPNETTFNNYDPLNRGCTLDTLRTCVIQSDQPSSCSSTTYSTGIPYSKVCGRIIGYQYGSPSAFNVRGAANGSDTNTGAIYVDGVSLTYGTQQHIWTFAAASNEQPNNICPCSNSGSPATAPPSFVGTDYFCDSAVASGNPQSRLYVGDPLWDGVGCDVNLTDCCSFNHPPWFFKALPGSTSDNINMTMCREQDRSVADLGLQIIDMLVQ